MEKEKFIGTWELVKMHEKKKDKVLYKPYGDSPLGYITYTPEGFMHAILMKKNRSRLGVSMESLSNARKTKNVFKFLKYIKAVINYYKASSSFVAYSGKFEIKGDEIFHNVTSSLVPDWIGQPLIREFSFLEDKMILTAKNDDGSKIELTWAKV